MGSMDRQELLEARGRLEAFLEPLLLMLGRSERRRWGALYVQGLLLEGGRKNAAGIAARYGGDVQALQQFISQSPWDWLIIRRSLPCRMMAAASPRGAWIVDDTGFPKKGKHSVGVARQYSGGENGILIILQLRLVHHHGTPGILQAFGPWILGRQHRPALDQ